MGLAGFLVHKIAERFRILKRPSVFSIALSSTALGWVLVYLVPIDLRFWKDRFRSFSDVLKYLGPFGNLPRDLHHWEICQTIDFQDNCLHLN